MRNSADVDNQGSRIRLESGPAPRRRRRQGVSHVNRTLVEILRKTVSDIKGSPEFSGDRNRLESLRQHLMRVIVELESQKTKPAVAN